MITTGRVVGAWEQPMIKKSEKRKTKRKTTKLEIHMTVMEAISVVKKKNHEKRRPACYIGGLYVFIYAYI